MTLRTWLVWGVLCLAIVSCGRQESVVESEALPLAQVGTELITVRDLEYLIDNVFIVGSVDEVAQKLNDLKGEIGDFGTLLAMGHEWEPYEAWHGSMSMLKNEVMPKVG